MHYSIGMMAKNVVRGRFDFSLAYIVVGKLEIESIKVNKLFIIIGTRVALRIVVQHQDTPAIIGTVARRIKHRHIRNFSG